MFITQFFSIIYLHQASQDILFIQLSEIQINNNIIMWRALLNYRYSRSHRLFLFAGQGTQEKGMFKFIEKQTHETIFANSKQILGIDIWEIATLDSNNNINQTEITQPLLLLSHYLHFCDKNYHLNINKDDYMIGHSLGQFSALVNAGSLSITDGLALVQKRGLLMKTHTLIPHSMLIVKYSPDKQLIVQQQIKKANLEIACINSRTNITVAGAKDKITALMNQFKKQRIGSMILPVSTAFHCRMLENMKEQFQQCLSKVIFQIPKCKIIRNYDCQIYRNSQDIRQGLLKQLTNPVLFYNSINLIPKDIELIQIGHKKSISKLAEQTLNSI